MRHLLAAPALLAALALAACRPDREAAAPPPEPPRPVQAAAIHLAPETAAQRFTGVVRARRESDAAFRAGGRIAARLVEVGERVAAGQPLARLDPADLALSLRSAEADLASAEATLRQAAADAARSRALLLAGHVAPAYDDQRVAAARTAAERVAAATAQRELAQNRLSYATLTAPADGVVMALLAEAGQVVAEGQPVLRLAQPAERELLVQIPEAAMAGLADRPAEAAFWARPGQVLAARLREVAPQADPVLRTYAARFSLPAAPDWVGLGMTGTIRLADARPVVARLPLAALHDRGQGPMVWRIARGRVEAVPVVVVALGDLSVAVTGALAEGEQVVALGPQLLDPGQAVRVVDTRLAATLR